jgi:hypothetical protein
VIRIDHRDRRLVSRAAWLRQAARALPWVFAAVANGWWKARIASLPVVAYRRKRTPMRLSSTFDPESVIGVSAIPEQVNDDSIALSMSEVVGGV